MKEYRDALSAAHERIARLELQLAATRLPPRPYVVMVPGDEAPIAGSIIVGIIALFVKSGFLSWGLSLLLG